MQTEYAAYGKKSSDSSEGSKSSLQSIVTNYKAPITADVLNSVREKAHKDGIGKNSIVKQRALGVMQKKGGSKEKGTKEKKEPKVVKK